MDVSPSSLPWITFVIRDVEGGVASMNHQIIENAPFRKYFNLRILLWREIEDEVKQWRTPFSTATEITRFEFSHWDNHYNTLKRFNAILNERTGIIVTNDGLEVESLRCLGTQSTLFAIVHDFYNLKLAIENMDVIDHYVCHTSVFTRALLSSKELQGRVHFQLHGVKVPVVSSRPANSTQPLRLVSISRLSPTKGVFSFSAIDDLLVKKGIAVEWIIIGSGERAQELKDQWVGKSNVSFHQPDTLNEVLTLAASGHCFVSPSIFEGYGIALLEAMSCGLAPIIHRLPVGVYSDLPENVGFSVDQGNLQGFADAIARLHEDRALLSRMGSNARKLVQEKYDILATAAQFMEIFREQAAPRINKALKAKQISKFGVLDAPFVPNSVTRWVRTLRSGRKTNKN